MQNIYQRLLQLIEKGEPIILGTLIDKHGSAPQVPGASAIFNTNGLLQGTLGGGILEAEAEKLAMKENGGNNLLRTVQYNAKINDDAGAICGGQASFILDFSPEIHAKVFSQMDHSLKNGQSGCLITFVDNEQHIKRYWLQEKEQLSEELIPYRHYIIKCHQNQPVGTYQLEQGFLLVERLQPAPRLIIIGGGHIGQALCHIGHLLDFEVTVLDNRPYYAKDSMFPDAQQLIIGDLNENIKALHLRPDSYVVIVTQGHKTDYASLLTTLQTDAGYIGMIGSKRKVKLIKEDLLQNQLATESELDTIYSPIGLDIGAKSVQEIAISIAAELVQVRHKQKSLNDVAMIILGAGKSTRMKKVKMLLPFGNQTIIETVVKTALNSKVTHTIVVTGANAEQITQQVKHLPVDVTFNRDYEEGMLSSVQCGINSANGFDAFLVLPGDQPFIQSATVNHLIDAYRKNDKGLVVPTYNGKKGHPVLINHKYKAQINQLDPNIGLRQLFHENADDILYLEINSDEVVIDLDNQEDYKGALERLRPPAKS